jgi:hypothetical protein
MCVYENTIVAYENTIVAYVSAYECSVCVCHYFAIVLEEWY